MPRTPTKETMNLNIREFPTDLYWKCRALGANEELNHCAYIIKVLRKITNTPDKEPQK
jgi:hypothetical protein